MTEEKRYRDIKQAADEGRSRPRRDDIVSAAIPGNFSTSDQGKDEQVQVKMFEESQYREVNLAIDKYYKAFKKYQKTTSKETFKSYTPAARYTAIRDTIQSLYKLHDAIVHNSVEGEYYEAYERECSRLKDEWEIMKLTVGDEDIYRMKITEEFKKLKKLEPQGDVELQPVGRRRMENMDQNFNRLPSIFPPPYVPDPVPPLEPFLPENAPVSDRSKQLNRLKWGFTAVGLLTGAGAGGLVAAGTVVGVRAGAAASDVALRVTPYAASATVAAGTSVVSFWKAWKADRNGSPQPQNSQPENGLASNPR